MPLPLSRTQRSCGVAAFAFAAGLHLLPAAAQLFAPQSLQAVEADVAKQFTDIEHLPSDGMAEILRRPDVMIFDVREPGEHAVSRIPGAVRVDPGAWTDAFLKQHAAELGGKTVVFYCSVGVRSAKFASRVQPDLKQAGVSKVYNLQGGIFRWHNEERGVVDDAGATPYLHPYNASWGKLVRRQELTRAAP
jgi:rhodanese-related sulfurtransferase